jgi:hypothetical protein
MQVSVCGSSAALRCDFPSIPDVQSVTEAERLRLQTHESAPAGVDFFTNQWDCEGGA